MYRYPEWLVPAGVNADGDAESRACGLAGLVALLALWLASGRLAAALAGTGLMVDGRSGPGLTWLIIFDFLIIKKTKPLSHLSQCGSGFVA